MVPCQAGFVIFVTSGSRLRAAGEATMSVLLQAPPRVSVGPTRRVCEIVHISRLPVSWPTWTGCLSYFVNIFTYSGTRSGNSHDPGEQVCEHRLTSLILRGTALENQSSEMRLSFLLVKNRTKQGNYIALVRLQSDRGRDSRETADYEPRQAKNKAKETPGPASWSESGSW